MNRITAKERPAMSGRSSLLLPLLCVAALALPTEAHASIFHGETLDKVANGIAWVVLVVAPVIAIGLFLIVHIMPEKIAEKREHPQAGAIQCLCLLSLFFGGMLWPLAWLWAFSKPVLYKMAYGTDKVPHGKEDAHAAPAEDKVEELKKLRLRVSELEKNLVGNSAAEKGKA